MDSAGLAAWIAHAAFWVLLAIGWVSNELGWRGLTVFLVLWVSGYFALPHVPDGAALLAPFVAVLDIGLVFAIFKGDVAIR